MCLYRNICDVLSDSVANFMVGDVFCLFLGKVSGMLLLCHKGSLLMQLQQHLIEACNG